MAVKAGRKVLIKIDTTGTGPSGSPNWVEIGQQRGGTLNLSADMADGTHKGDGGWKSQIPTYKGWGIEFDGALNPADPIWAQIRNALKSDTILWVMWDRSQISGTDEYGQAYLSELSEEAPGTDVVTFSGTLVGEGALDPATV